MLKIGGSEKQEALDLVSQIQQQRSGIALGNISAARVPMILLKYQVLWHQDTSPVRFCVKGRRIGFTWGAWAAEAALEAARPGRKGMDQFYMGYNQAMAAEFIGDVATFARWYQQAISDIAVGYETLVIANERTDILTYQVKFASGHVVQALSSAPHSWRGHQGHGRVDEAAFHNNLQEVIKGALAFRMWGGRLSVGSTESGEENEFHVLRMEIKAGKLPWSLHEITLDDALRDGLYERICLVTKKEYSIEAERAFRAAAYADYPSVEDADEELQAIAKRGSGAYFSRLMIENCAQPGVPDLRWIQSPTFVLDPERVAIAHRWIAEHLAPVIDALPLDQDTVFGQDFGRHGDASDIVALQQESAWLWRTAFVLTMREIPFDVQRVVVTYLIEHLPRLRAMKFDASGNGASHAEAAQQQRPQLVECVKLSAQWYDQNFPRYLQAYTGGNIIVQQHEDWITDHNLVVKVGGCPRISGSRMKGTDGFFRHGDRAVAGCLAWAATTANIQPAAGASVEPDPELYAPTQFPGHERTEMFGRVRRPTGRISGGPP